MLSRFIERLLHEEEEVFEDQPKQAAVKKSASSRLIWEHWLALGVFGVALAARLYSLFWITDPQNAGAEVWYSDVYHHWQIAYLSKTVGFGQGFLHLWDLKGLEYFWGLMHPLVGSILMSITGSTNILIMRLLSLVMGAVGLAFLYLIVRRYWGWQAGLAAALIGTLNPVGIFNDASGMVEPLGITLMLAGIFTHKHKPWLAGILIAMAGMTRAEYWLLGIGVVGAMVLIRDPQYVKRRYPLLGTYSVAMVLYMKYLLDRTGNLIYPIWWNFLGNAAGKWQADIAPTMEQLLVQKIYWAIAGAAVIGLLLVVRKRPRHSPLFVFGFGNWLLWGVVIGMTSYLLSYLPRFWVDRIMLWPYMFLGAFVAIQLFRVIPDLLPRKIAMSMKLLSWIGVAAVIVALQALWVPIHHYYDDTHKYWDNFTAIAKEVGSIDSGEGRVLVPEPWPPLTYLLVHEQGITGERIVGQMFDPYFYMEGDAYDNWGENRQIVLDWLVEEDVRLLFFPLDRERYVTLVEKEAEFFEPAGVDEPRGFGYYVVNQERLRGRE